MKAREVSASMRGLASRVQRRFPGHVAHQHLRDAAGAVDRGHPDGAIRHLNAAISSFAPMQLRRAGIHDDAAHIDAKKLMSEAHRHLLLTKDIQDAPGPTAAHLSADPQRTLELASRARAVMGL
jgi:hypothetical protein